MSNTQAATQEAGMEQTQDFFAGQIFIGDYPPEAAAWCNAGQRHSIRAISSENGRTCFEIYALPEPTAEELQERMRQRRNACLTLYVDAYAGNALRWAEMTDQEKADVAGYRRYLLDYPQQPGNWWNAPPLDFEEWKAGNN